MIITLYAKMSSCVRLTTVFADKKRNNLMSGYFEQGDNKMSHSDGWAMAVIIMIEEKLSGISAVNTFTVGISLSDKDCEIIKRRFTRKKVELNPIKFGVQIRIS